MKWPSIIALCGCLLSIANHSAFAADAPPRNVFQVLPPQMKQGPEITSYLKYQTEMAWEQDEQRRKAWAKIETQQDLLRVQQQIRQHLLAMIGGLPSVKTPLQARTTGTVAK